MFINREIEYSYHVQRIPFADYRVNQLMPVVSVEEFDRLADTKKRRLLRKRYGVKIEFYQSGRLGKQQNWVAMTGTTQRALPLKIRLTLE